MKVIYAHVKGGNFGDDLNEILWKDLFPNINDIAPNEAILGIGTLQGIHIPSSYKKVHVFGTGAYDSPAFDWLGKNNFVFHFVRGPLTEKRWGLSGKKLTDGAILLMHSSLKNIQPKTTKKIGFIPHHSSDKWADYERILSDTDIEYISTLGTNSVTNFIAQVKGCDYIITEALHGAIIADLFRKPWVSISTGAQVYDFKWNDWCQSLNLSYQPYSFDGLVTRNIAWYIRCENIYKRGFNLIGIGKDRWRNKRILFNNKKDEFNFKEKLLNIVKEGKWTLSSDLVMDDLINKSGDIVSKLNSFR
jgi:succinoglycan biosynthesis protein ExoV